MSARFPDEMRCPDCGLTVAGNVRKGVLRAHGRKAVEAGRGDAACAALKPGTRRAEEAEAREHRRAAGARRAEWWASRDQEPTVVGEGTAQRR